MSSRAGAVEPTASGPGIGRLWSGFLGPPVIWAVRLGVSYTLVPYACWWSWIPVLNLVTLGALAATAAMGLLAWRGWRAVGAGREVELGGRATRIRFMAILGMASSALFFLVIAAEGLASLFIDPCQTGGVPLP